MTTETPATEETAAAEGTGRSWRPSRPPEHRNARRSEAAPRIVQRSRGGGFLGPLRAQLGNRLVRIAIGLALFITAVLVFDHTLNGGAWTERPPRPKPTPQSPPHRPPPPDL